MSEVVKQLQDRRLKVWEERKGIAERTAADKRNRDGEEDRQWEELNAELAKLDDRIKAILTGEQRAKDAEDAMDRLAGKPVDTRAGQGQGAPAVDYAAEIRKLAQQAPGQGFDIPLPRGVEQRTLLDSNVP